MAKAAERITPDHPGRALIACETAATRAQAALNDLMGCTVPSTFEGHRADLAAKDLRDALARIVDVASGRVQL